MATYIAFLSLGPIEVLVILLVALLIFGRRLPEVARSLGQGLVEFRKGLHDEPGLADEPRPLPEQPQTEGEEKESLTSEETVEYDAQATEDDEAEKTDPAG